MESRWAGGLMHETTQWLGTWLFIMGAFGMMIGSFGNLMVAWEEYVKKRMEQKV